MKDIFKKVEKVYDSLCELAEEITKEYDKLNSQGKFNEADKIRDVWEKVGQKIEDISKIRTDISKKFKK